MKIEVAGPKQDEGNITNQSGIKPGIYYDKDGDYLIVLSDRTKINATREGLVFSGSGHFETYAPYRRCPEGTAVALSFTQQAR